MGKRSKRGRSTAAEKNRGGPSTVPATAASEVPPTAGEWDEATTTDTGRGSPRRRPRTGSDADNIDNQRKSGAGLRASRREDDEGPDNLRFEDPFPDEYEDEDEDDDAVGSEGDDNDDEGDWSDDEVDGTAPSKRSGMEDVVQAWNPFFQGGDDGEDSQHQSTRGSNVKLEMDPTAYKLHHALTPEWPSLSFDFVRDSLGVRSNTQFPHSIVAVVGTQADRPADNRVTVMKLSDLSRIQAETDDDILGEEYDPRANSNGSDDDDDDDSDIENDDADDVDVDPIVEHYSIKHYGGVNRIRSMPQNPGIVATWSDAGRVNLFHIQSILQRFDASEGAGSTNNSSSGKMPDIPTKPNFSYAKHNTEGFALDWSACEAGQLATGDCHGGIHLWSPRPDGTHAISKAYDDSARTTAAAAGDGDAVMLSSTTTITSVEDLQWSPTERTVLASAECGGYVRIYDTRAPHRAMLSHLIHDNRSDVNVLSWNRLVSNLLATGSDDGVLSVWDLRHFAAPASAADKSDSKPHPLARFTPHTTPITSVEWHPTDESMLVVTDDRGAYVYDLSVEEDDTAYDTDAGATVQPKLPPQLLFVHCGSEQFKEAHWHPQIPSMVMTTALSGYSVFIPSNL